MNQSTPIATRGLLPKNVTVNPDKPTTGRFLQPANGDLDVAVASGERRADSLAADTVK